LAVGSLIGKEDVGDDDEEEEEDMLCLKYCCRGDKRPFVKVRKDWEELVVTRGR
jgi:hypothetical protein